MPAFDARQMAAAMRRMGIETHDIPDVEEVVVRTAERDYLFRRPQVSVMKAQGTETWQVIGRPEELAKGAGARPATPPPMGIPLPDMPQPASPIYEPGDDDVRTVMEAAGVDAAAARQALSETGGDLAEAILKLGG